MGLGYYVRYNQRSYYHYVTGDEKIRNWFFSSTMPLYHLPKRNQNSSYTNKLYDYIREFKLFGEQNKNTVNRKSSFSMYCFLSKGIFTSAPRAIRE